MAGFIPSIYNPAIVALPGWYNVKSYGALGDGTTDDTVAIQTASDACAAVGGGIVFFPPGVYFVNGSFGGSNSENSQIRLPSLGMSTVPNIGIRYIGTSSPQVLWGLTSLPVPSGGSIIKTTKTGSGNLFGCKAPSGDSIPYSSITASFENLTILTYDNPDVTPFDLRGAANAILRDVCILPSRPSHTSIPQPTNSGQFAVRMPSTNSSAICLVDNLTVYNHYSALEIGECFQGVGQVFLYACQRGVVATSMNHGASFTNLQTTKCPQALVGPSSGKARILIESWRYEYILSTWAAETATIDDAGNRLYGSATICPVQAAVGADTHTVKNGATNFTLTAI